MKLFSLIRMFFCPTMLVDTFFTLRGGDGDGGGGGGGTTTSTSYSTNLPEYAQPYYQELLKQTGKEVFQTDKAGTVTGMKPASNLPLQTVSGFNPLQTEVQNEIAAYQTPESIGRVGDIGSMYGEQGLAAAMGNTQDYMSPYIQGALNPQIEELNRQSALNQRNAGLKAAAAGTFGGARGAFMQAQIARDAQRNIADTLGRGYQSAFEAAQSRQRDMGDLGVRSLDLGLKGGLAKQQADLERLTAQGAVGTQQQDLSQRQADADYQNRMAQLNYPRQSLQFYSDILRGNAGALGSTQVQYTPTPSTLSQIGGLGLAGLGLARALK